MRRLRPNMRSRYTVSKRFWSSIGTTTTGMQRRTRFMMIQAFYSSLRMIGRRILALAILHSPAREDSAGFNINVHLECASKDVDMLRYWDRLLTPAVASFRPDFVLISAGFDSRMDDLLGCFNLTDDSFRRMTRMAMDYAHDSCDGRVVSLLEGAYNVGRNSTGHSCSRRDTPRRLEGRRGNRSLYVEAHV